MKELFAWSNENFLVMPRWPYTSVLISDKAFELLCIVQKNLVSHDVQLILTRGFEKNTCIIKLAHSAARIIGGIIFMVIYPRRHRECFQIFSGNGHEKDGNSIDVSVFYKGKKIILLPFGVFTNIKTAKKNAEMHKDIIYLVQSKLQDAGFSVNKNFIESLQIHCDLNHESATRLTSY